MLQENNKPLSFQMARAVKAYKLENSAKYHAAMKKTGPVDFSKVYSNLKDEHKDGYKKNSFISADDPYWVDFFEKNYRTQDRYKHPSAMEWDYKPNGIFDEIIDMKEFARKEERARHI